MSTDICRSCLTPTNTRYSVMDDVVRSGFEELAGILVKPQDGLPQLICEVCKDLFVKFTEFRIKIKTNHMYLMESLNDIQGAEAKSETTCKSEFDADSIDYEAVSDGENKQPLINVKLKKICTKKETRKKRATTRKHEKLTSKPRTIIRVDPDKINTIQLSIEEQLRCHDSEKEKPEFLAMPYKCMLCFKGFNFERKLKAHADKYHELNSQYKCIICSRTMSSRASLQLHTQKHEYKYECRMCHKRYSEKRQAVSHYSVAHEGGTVEIPCPLCGKVFRHRSTLNGHIRSQHAQETVKCDVCQKTFKSKDSLQDHMLIHTGEKNYICNECPKRFRLRSSLKVHTLSHCTLRPHYCPTCDVQFKTRTSLVRHDRRHGRQQKHICPVCGQVFSSTGSLRVHSLFHDKGPREKCGQCQAVLPIAALKYHIRRHGYKRSKNHVCHECAQRFTTPTSLARHLMIHSGEKPYVCEHCGATFRQNSTRQTHIRLVHLKIKRKRAA